MLLSFLLELAFTFLQIGNTTLDTCFGRFFLSCVYEQPEIILPNHVFPRYWNYGIMTVKKREMLDFWAFPAFLVSNLLLVQCKKYYFNRFMVSRNWSMVL